jgi:hypothetical protein
MVCANLRDAAKGQGRDWFRDLDSNQDSQLQRLMCYRLHYPGTADNSLAEEKECAKPGNVRGGTVSAKLVRLRRTQERWPSGLRRTLGKRV